MVIQYEESQQRERVRVCRQARRIKSTVGM